MSIEIDLRTDLHKVRAAFNAGQLQMQQPGYDLYTSTCFYAGPCAVGVMVAPELRAGLDGDAGYSRSVRLLLDEGEIVAPADQHDDIINLQHDHDNLHPGDFSLLLARLEEKYA